MPASALRRGPIDDTIPLVELLVGKWLIEFAHGELTRRTMRLEREGAVREGFGKLEGRHELALRVRAYARLQTLEFAAPQDDVLARSEAPSRNRQPVTFAFLLFRSHELALRVRAYARLQTLEFAAPQDDVLARSEAPSRNRQPVTFAFLLF